MRRYQTDDELSELAEQLRRYDRPVACSRCRRSLAECRQADDLPVIVRAGEVVCAGCTPGNKDREPGHGERQTGDMEGSEMARLRWTECYGDSDVPLWQEAAELRASGLTWIQVADALEERHGITITVRSMATAAKRYGGDNGQAGKPVPRTETAGSSGGEAENGARARPPVPRDGDGDDENPFDDGGEDEPDWRGVAEPLQELAARDDFHLELRTPRLGVRVEADSEFDFRVRLGLARSLLSMGENVAGGGVDDPVPPRGGSGDRTEGEEFSPAGAFSPPA